MVRKIISIFLVLLCFNASAQKFLSKNGIISFFSEAPMEDIFAVNEKVSAIYDIKNKDIIFQLRISDFIFPKPLMQEHFNENYLESDIFPKSTFIGKVISFNGDLTTVEGELTMHGKTNKIKVDGKIELAQNKVIISTVFSVKLEDYDIDIPSIVMYKIAEEIEIKVNIELYKVQ